MCGSLMICSTYESGKVVRIPNAKLGIIQRILTLTIICYVVFWVFYYAKLYQIQDVGQNSLITDLKAIGFTAEDVIQGQTKRVWDELDIAVPHLEDSALFVTTNIIITENQALGKCAEDSSISGSKCTSDEDCKSETIINEGNGVMTGTCLLHQGKTEGLCEIEAWCPLENDTLPLGGKTYIFHSVQDYTLLIKNHISFEKFGVHRRNILPWASEEFLKSCIFDPNDAVNKYCPVFKLGTIFEMLNLHEHFFITGGVIGINIRWDCDLDWSVDYCLPEYSFVQLSEAEAKISPGFNFRHGYFYRERGVLHRDMIKAFGVRFIIDAYGVAGKFDFNEILMNFGSALGLLDLVVWTCDFIAFTLLAKRDLYSDASADSIEESIEKNVCKRKAVTFENEVEEAGPPNSERMIAEDTTV